MGSLQPWHLAVILCPIVVVVAAVIGVVSAVSRGKKRP
ncbi:Sec-independent protein translocase protein TatA [Longispora fulva]|uniref:Sec-independent protein translocase protein TatA n=1 Tax=Longispora fulva TaxID=619741 RepID=A0A8J7GIS9_9ACTN|nr:Sec-independent protein translocase protein TatA [Longispora fulva]